MLPEHVWSKTVGNNGKALKAFRPEQHLPPVAGGPYTITQFQEKGTTVFKPNPYFYGPKSNAEAVTMTYYTNSTSMIADLQAGNIDFADQVPFNAISSLKSDSQLQHAVGAEPEVTNITLNSNPLKPKNRELLNPTLREALEYATDRNAIVKVIYAGHARPWANLLSLQSGSFWLNPAIKPLPFDMAKANQMLDSLGYTKGSDGIRVVPATTGQVRSAGSQDGVRRDRAGQPRLQRRPPVPSNTPARRVRIALQRIREHVRLGGELRRREVHEDGRPVALSFAISL